jgi:O-antigen ligase
MLISGIGIFCGLCRGAILGYILFLTLYIYTIVKNKGILKKIIALVSVVSCLLIINYHFDIWGTLQERENISESYSSGDYSAGRFERWAKVLNYMDLHDCYLFGTKIYNTPMIRSEQGTPKGLMHEFSPHNVYLAYLIETGIIGILLIACIYIIIMKRVLHYDRDLFIGLLIFMGVSFNTELCTNTLAYTFIFCFIYYSSFILTKSNYER